MREVFKRVWRWIMGLFSRKVGLNGKVAEKVVRGENMKVWKHNDVSGGVYLIGFCPRCGKRMWSDELSHTCRKKGRLEARLRYGAYWTLKAYRKPLWQRPVPKLGVRA